MIICFGYESKLSTNQPPKVNGFIPKMTHFVGQLGTRYKNLTITFIIPAIVVTAPFWTGPQIFSGSKPSRSFRCPAEACLSQGPSPRNHRRFQSCHRPCDSRCRRNSLKGPGVLDGNGMGPCGHLWRHLQKETTRGSIIMSVSVENWAGRSNQNTSKKRPLFLDTLYYYSGVRLVKVKSAVLLN